MADLIVALDKTFIILNKKEAETNRHPSLINHIFCVLFLFGPKELSASNSSRKSFDSVLENQCEFKQHYNHYRASSPPYDRKQDHFF